MSNQGSTIKINAQGRTIVSVDNFAIAPDCVTFLFGESGIGKSTICKALYGLLDPDELSITLDNMPYAKHCTSPWVQQIKESSFFVFQEPSSHLNPLMKINEQITEASLGLSKNDADIFRSLWQSSDDTALRKILDIYPKPYRPSGGEKQRILLAMAFKKLNILLSSNNPQRPTFFVFDEPTGSLDDNYRNLFLGLLFEKFAQRPFTAVIITHDYSIISEVYKNHKKLISRVQFKELSRNTDSTVSLIDFSADDYLTWLGAARSSRKTIAAGDSVLQVEPFLRVFGRSLCIYGDKNRSKQKPFLIRKGEMVYLKAPSGVGKTTVAKVVMGLYDAQEFSMTLGGIRISQRTDKGIWSRRIWGKKAGMVFQHADEALNLQATVEETFAGLPTKVKITGDRLTSLLNELFPNELSPVFLKKKVALLSGGQKQRLNLLRSLALQSDLIVLDEPLNGLDFNSITKVLAMLERKRSQGSALFMISHNEEIFDSIIDEEHTYYLAELKT